MPIGHRSWLPWIIDNSVLCVHIYVYIYIFVSSIPRSMHNRVRFSRDISIGCANSFEFRRIFVRGQRPQPLHPASNRACSRCPKAVRNSGNPRGIPASAPPPRNKNFTHTTRLFWRILVDRRHSEIPCAYLSQARIQPHIWGCLAYLVAFTCTRLSHIFHPFPSD